LGRVKVRDERFKDVHEVDGESEPHDLQTDPTEGRNLPSNPDHVSEVNRLRGALIEHTRRGYRFRSLPNVRPPEPERARIESKYRKQRPSPNSSRSDR